MRDHQDQEGPLAAEVEEPKQEVDPEDGEGGAKGRTFGAGEAEWREQAELGLSLGGLFTMYVVHDALQERAFRRPGFTFGWAMTAMEMGAMFCCALISERASNTTPGKSAKDLAPSVKRHLAVLVLVIAISQGTGSMALAFVSYPAKVAFKSCKLIPTMAFSRCLAGGRYGPLDYAAAVLMCLALMALGLADSKTVTGSKRARDAARAKQLFGFWLLAIAVCSDSIIPNLQDKLLRGLHLPTNQMVVLSNLGSFVLVVLFILLTGEAQAFAAYCRRDPATLGLLCCQAISAYLGLRSYLALIKKLSGVGGVIATSARKVLTLILSFVLFRKPFYQGHALALFLLFLGVALATVAKQRKKLHQQLPPPQKGAPAFERRR